MGSHSHWLFTGCLCLVISLARPASVTPGPADSIVVSKSDDTSAATVETIVSKATESASTPVTEGPLLPIKMLEMDVKSEVSMRYAHTAVVTRVRNPATRAQEAHFRVLLPETAFISGFTMILDGKPYKAYVQEKEQAKKTYTEAVSQGIGAAHIAAKARDSNHFTVSVNVEPNVTAVFNLTYEELLVRRNKVYNHAINLHPGELVPSLKVTVHIKEPQKINTLRVPEVRTGNEIDASETDPQNSKAVIEKSKDGREATITFTPDLQEQIRLRDIYAEKTKESAKATTMYGWYGYREEQKETEPQNVLGQFVVQYDVDRPKEGEILVNDGYFVHFFAPSTETLPPLKKHVVFVLDTSGSMSGRKIEQLRLAMQTILSELNKGDYFNIVEFSSSIQVHDVEEGINGPSYAANMKIRENYYYDSSPALTLKRPTKATPENIEKAKSIVKNLSASGGTNISGALSAAIELIRKGINPKEPTAPATSQPQALKDAENKSTTAPSKEITSTTATPKKIESEVSNESVNLEPMIIFLTDGEPTIGESNPSRITSQLTEKNYGVKKASIFSLAFGEDADRKFLRKLSLKNEGFMRHIYEAADAALQLRDFYRQVSSPLLADVKFVYPKEQIKEGSLTKNKFRTYYADSEAIVAGQIIDDKALYEPKVEGFCGVQDDFIRIPFEVKPIVRKTEGYLPLERLWAYLTIKQLLDAKDADEISEDAASEDKTPEKKALEIALKYEFVTPLTSLVVVKPNATKAVDAESVDKQSDGYALGLGLNGPPTLGAIQFSPQASGFGAPNYPAGLPGLAFSYRPMASHEPAGQLRNSGIVNLIDTLQYIAALTEREGVHSHSGGHNYRFMTRTSLDAVLRGPPRATVSNDRILGMPGLSAQADLIPPSTYAPYLTTKIPDLVSTAAQTYHLSDYTWVLRLPRKDDKISLPTQNNGTVELKLSKDASPPKSPSGDAECPSAVGGTGAGVCVYLTRCDSARNITETTYADTYCQVNNEYAGVCCPKDKVDLKTLGAS